MNFQNLIKKICEEENITYHLISDGYCFVLNKDDKTRYIMGRNFSLNDQAISHIIDDKYALYSLCNLENLPIIKHHILYNPKSEYGSDTYIIAHKLFQDYHNNIVIKPNKGSEGDSVYHITNIDELYSKINSIFQDNYSISLCPYYDITSEFRVVVLDNVVKLIYEKERPKVVGDGIHSIKELLIKLNPYYFGDVEFNQKYNRILMKGEEYLYDWHFNLSKGAVAKWVSDEKLRERLSKLATDITKCINATFVTVDIIMVDNELYLLEINSRVCISKACHFIDRDYEITKSIYKDAIYKMFE